MHADLKDVMKTVNSWLVFAESKNAAIVTFNIAVGFGIISFIESKNNIPCMLLVYTYVVVLLLGVGAVVGILSFLPSLTNLAKQQNSKEKRDNNNLLYFYHIAEYDVDEYLKGFSLLIGSANRKYTPIEKAYANQIISNSRIAVRKYQYFTCSLWFTIIALAPPLAIFIGLLYLINKGDTHD